jgi:hypothetical protein
MTAHDDLLRQLKESIRTAGAGAPAPRRARRTPLLAALAALVVGGGVATAAVVTHTGDGGDHRSAHEVAYAAVLATQDDAACRTLKPGATITTELVPIDPSLKPLLAGPPSAAALTLARRMGHSGPVIAGTARHITLPSGNSIVLWVAAGDTFAARADPGACLQARLAVVGPSHPAAAKIIRNERDTRPDAQTLYITLHHADENNSGGAGLPLDGRPVPTGVVASGGGHYIGLAARGARTITVDNARLHRTFTVVRGVFVVDLPDHTGPLTLRQRAADGRVVAQQTLRG